MVNERYKMSDNESEKGVLNLPFTGICSFGKYPICTNLDELDADLAIIGMPFEATQWRSGSKFGPRGLRDASTLFSFGLNGVYDQVNDEMILEPPTRIVDCGDVDMIHGDMTKCLANIEKDVSKIVAKGAIPIGLGGDHAVSVPFGYGLKELGPINVIQIDAHLDFCDHRSGQRWGQGSPMRRLSEAEHVDKMWQIGIRGIGSSRKIDFDAARNYGSQIISPRDLRKMGGVQALLKQFPKDERYYISFDIDGLDITYASGTGTPSPGGLTYDEANELLVGIAERGEVVGMDLVEVAPCLDLNQATSIVASRLIDDLIAAVLQKKKRQGLLKGQK